MGVMEVSTKVSKKKRKQKLNTDENDYSHAQAKVAKICKEKKSTARRPHDSDVVLKNDSMNDRRKLKPMQKIVKTDGNKRKPKMVRILLV